MINLLIQEITDNRLCKKNYLLGLFCSKKFHSKKSSPEYLESQFLLKHEE